MGKGTKRKRKVVGSKPVEQTGQTGWAIAPVRSQTPIFDQLVWEYLGGARTELEVISHDAVDVEVVSHD